jgi:hypothetical protein
MLRAAVAAMLLIASAAQADVIYKVRLKDGSIAFTDKPPADAVVLERREFTPTPAAPPAATAKKAPARAVDERPRETESKLDAAIAEIAAAERALEQAKENLGKGREPREGDFLGTAKKGFVRPSPSFEQRIAELEQAVVKAEERLKKAYDARNAAR